VVQDYSHEKAPADGVNVGYDVYRIETKVTSGGATLEHEPDDLVPHRDRRTRKTLCKELDDDLTYTANQLDLDLVNRDQLRPVIRTFRDRLFTEIFPAYTGVGRPDFSFGGWAAASTEHAIRPPKVKCGRLTPAPETKRLLEERGRNHRSHFHQTKTDLHADDIVQVIREEFGKGNEFCQKITSKTTGKKPEVLLNEFRNSYNPRIAVTVDMIATGTDVKPLECLLFMRNINSASYFEQMKGRGCRIVSSDDLQGVTRDARHKTRFVIVDAVGVCAGALRAGPSLVQSQRAANHGQFSEKCS
jgi:type I restriction enzyme R subunit